MERSTKKRSILGTWTPNEMNILSERDAKNSSTTDCKNLIKCLSSNKTIESSQPIKETHLTSKEAESSTQSQTSSSPYHYEVKFPPGSIIGLEFEPTRANHKIGCQVKNINSSANISFLKKIQRGHVVNSIDGIDVTFLYYSDILHLLDQRINLSKTIGFKIIATTEYPLAKDPIFLPPSTPLTPSHQLPATPRNVHFRIPSSPSASVMSASPPLSPQQEEIHSSSFASSAHLSTYSISNAITPTKIEPIPSHHFSRVTSLPPQPPPAASSVLNSSTLPHRTFSSPPRDRQHNFPTSQFPSSPPSSYQHPPHSPLSHQPLPSLSSLSPNYEQKYQNLLQELSQSYLKLQEYQNRVIAFEEALREYRRKEEYEKRKQSELREKYLKLEKSLEEITELRGEEIADRDAWVSRALTAEQMINEQKLEYKSKSTELMSRYQKSFEEVQEEYQTNEKNRQVELISLREELKRAREREEETRRIYQQDLSEDHQQKLSMIHFHERERIQREEEKDKTLRQIEQLNREIRELRIKLDKTTERAEELEEKALKAVKVYESSKKEWDRERFLNEEENREHKDKIGVLKRENDLLKMMSTNTEKDFLNKERHLENEKEDLKRTMEQMRVNLQEIATEKQLLIDQFHESEKQLLQQREEERKSGNEKIFKLESQLIAVQKECQEMAEEVKRVSIIMKDQHTAHENDLKDKEGLLKRLKSERIASETESRERERELRNNLLRVENEKQRSEEECSEVRRAMAHLKIQHQEQSLAMLHLEVTHPLLSFFLSHSHSDTSSTSSDSFE
jgi:hypothetical protein